MIQSFFKGLVITYDVLSRPLFFLIIIIKCHVLVTKQPIGIKIGSYTTYNSECEKVLGVRIDVNLNFNDHLSDLCKKTSRKISTLARVTPFMD